MIKENDLNEAIAECLGQRNPNTSTCLKLAAFFTIKKELFGDVQDDASVPTTALPSFTYAEPPQQQIDYYGDSEFAKLIHGKSVNDVMSVMDELMEALQVVNPRLYDGTLRRLR